MPNHVSNLLNYVGSPARIAEVKNFVKSSESDFDFNKIVPMPETFNRFDTTNHPAGRGLEIGKKISHLPGAPIVTKELIQQYKDATREQAERYGVIGWYDWHCRYWGTKWNAYDIETFSDDSECVRFDTAWTCPAPAIKELSRLFPDVRFELTYADEDSGYNCGCICYERGAVVYEDIPAGGSDKAWEYYFQLHEWAREYYRKNKAGKWEYVEETEEI